jgi:hypothetical protein
MTVTVAAAALTLAAGQLKPVSEPVSVTLAAVAAVALAVVGLLRSREDAEQTRRWTRARSVSEAIKADVYTFLAGSAQDAATAQQQEEALGAAVDRLEVEAADLVPYAHGLQAKMRDLPAVRDVPTYLDIRVEESQLKTFYEPKALTLRKNLQLAKSIEVGLTLIAAALAAVAAISPNIGAWATVATAAVGAVAAYAAAERYEFLWIEYSRTAAELRRLLDRRTAADGTRLSGMDLVQKCEDVISIQNQAWMAKWGEQKKGKQAT